MSIGNGVHEAGTNRREFITTGLVLALGGGVVGATAVEAANIIFAPTQDPDIGALKRLQKMGESLSYEVIKPGQTIPGPMPTDIPKEGWTLVARPYLAYPYIEGTNLLMGIATSNTLADPLDDFLGIQNEVLLGGRSTPKRQGDDKPREWRVRPTTVREFDQAPGLTDQPQASSMQYDISASSIDGNTIYKNIVINVPYRITWFEGQTRREDLVNPKSHKVVSERPIDSELHGRLDGLMHFYQGYMSRRSPTLIVPKSSSGKTFSLQHNLTQEEASYDANDDILTISEAFLVPSFINYVLPHELNHAIFFDFKDGRENKGLKGQFQAVYANYIKTLDHKKSSSSQTCTTDYSDVLKVFDESNYIDVNCGIGHPGDDPDELFASGLNCMRHFEKQMLEKIQELNPHDRAVAVHVVRLITQITDRMSQESKNKTRLVADNSPLRSIS